MAANAGLGWGGRLFFGGLTGGTFCLGCWQTQRYYEKIDLIKQRDEDKKKDPQPLDGTILSGMQRAFVEGTFHHPGEILVGPRGPPPGVSPDASSSSRRIGGSGGGMSISQQGYYVITPLEYNNGQTVLVNRGWIPKKFLDKGIPVDRPEGIVRIVGVKSKPEKPRFMIPEHDFTKRPLTFFWMDFASMEMVSGLPAGSGTFLTQIKESSERYPITPSLDTIGQFYTTPLVHAGYAITWYGLAISGVYLTRKLIMRGR